MHNKFQCHYRLLVNWIDDNGNPKQEIVKDPVTIEFNVTKSTQPENSTRITIYNLDGATREAIYQDRIMLDTNPYIKWVSLEAGYSDQLTLVSWGYVQECHSYRSGVDFVTVIDVTDPDILTEYCGTTFEAGTTFKEAYKYLVSNLPSLKIGETGVLEGAFQVPTVFDGNTFVLINKLTGGHTFIDNGVINTLNDNETLSDYGCYLIAADTGLLETPKRYDHILEISMLFEPTIKVGQLVEIKSSTQTRFDGQYKVLSVNHNCMISGAESGTRTTTLQLQFIETLPNSNENLTANPSGSASSIVKNNEVRPINSKISSSVQAVYKYIKEHAGAVKQGLFITNRISWREMIYSGKNQPNNVFKQVNTGILANCENIATKLTDFVNTYYPGAKIVVHSGYRTAQNNVNTEGSAKKSNHLKGAAIDFHLEGVSVAQMTKRFKQSWRYGLGTYSWGLHVSLNPRERFRGKG